MIGLKTLKDLMIKIPLAGIQTRVVGFSEIKQEAINWIKADTKDLCEILEEELSERDLIIIDKVLTKFNNLTAEELK